MSSPGKEERVTTDPITRPQRSTTDHTSPSYLCIPSHRGRLIFGYTRFLYPQNYSLGLYTSNRSALPEANSHRFWCTQSRGNTCRYYMPGGKLLLDFFWTDGGSIYSWISYWTYSWNRCKIFYVAPAFEKVLSLLFYNNIYNECLKAYPSYRIGIDLSL